MRWSLCVRSAALVSVLCTWQAGPAHAQSTARTQTPALPILSLDTFPAAAREAISVAQREAVARPDDANAVGQLAMVLHAWEQWQTAAQVYERARTLDPRSADWPYLGAVVALRMGMAADAAVMLDAAVKMTPAAAPANLAARIKLAEALLNAGDVARGAEVYQALAREPAAQPEAEYGLGRIAAMRGRWTDAIAHHTRACELFPEFGAAHYALALAYRNAGRMDDAQRELDLHRRFGPRWPKIDDPLLDKVSALKVDARADLERGIKLGNEGRIEEAIAAHEAALAKTPDIAQIHANLISLNGRLGRWADAEKHFRAVVALKSNLDEAYYLYGVVLGMQKREPEAAEAFRQAIAVNPLHAQAHNNLGVLYERERRWEDAVGAYRRAVEGQPAFRLGRFNLGRMLIALGRNDEAATELEKLLTPEDQESPRYIYALATAHLRAGRIDRGLAYARQAHRLALAHDQSALAAAIDKDLASLPAARRP